MLKLSLISLVALGAAQSPSDLQNVASQCKADISNLCGNTTTPLAFASCFANNFQCISSACQQAVLNAQNNAAGGNQPLPIVGSCLQSFNTNCGSVTGFQNQLSCWAAVDPSTLPVACVAQEIANRIPPPPMDFKGICGADVTTTCSTAHNDIASQANCLQQNINVISTACKSLVSGIISKVGGACTITDMNNANCTGTIGNAFPCLIQKLQSVSVNCSLSLQSSLPPPPQAIQQFLDPLAPCLNGGLGSQACLGAVLNGTCAANDVLACSTAQNATALVKCLIQQHNVLSPKCGSFVARLLQQFGPGQGGPGGQGFLPTPPANLNPFSVCSTADLPSPTACGTLQTPLNKTNVACFIRNANQLKAGACSVLINGIANIPTVACAVDCIKLGISLFAPADQKIGSLLANSGSLSGPCSSALHILQQAGGARRSLVTLPPPNGPIGWIIGNCSAEVTQYCPISQYAPGTGLLLCLLKNATNIYSGACQTAVSSAAAAFPIPSDLAAQCSLELAQASQTVTLSNPTCVTASGLTLWGCIKDNLSKLATCTGQTTCCSALASTFQRVNQMYPQGDLRSVCGNDFGNFCANLNGPALVACINSNVANFAQACQGALTNFLQNNGVSGGLVPKPQNNTGCSIIDMTTSGANALILSATSSDILVQSYAYVSTSNNNGGTTPATTPHANGIGQLTPSTLLVLLAIIVSLVHF